MSYLIVFACGVGVGAAYKALIHMWKDKAVKAVKAAGEAVLKD